jgi:hypothetical protein
VVRTGLAANRSPDLLCAWVIKTSTNAQREVHTHARLRRRNGMFAHLDESIIGAPRPRVYIKLSFSNKDVRRGVITRTINFEGSRRFPALARFRILEKKYTPTKLTRIIKAAGVANGGSGIRVTVKYSSHVVLGLLEKRTLRSDWRNANFY